MSLSSSGVGEAPKYFITIALDVGEHQTSPPPPNSGYSPEWMFCAYGGTASSTWRPSVNVLMALWWSGYAALVMVVTASRRGVVVAPAGRSSRTWVWKASGLRFLRLAKVSVRT